MKHVVAHAFQKADILLPVSADMTMEKGRAIPRRKGIKLLGSKAFRRLSVLKSMTACRVQTMSAASSSANASAARESAGGTTSLT